MPVAGTEGFADVKQRMEGEKAGILARHRTLLEERYDLANRAESGAQMTRGKAVQGGVRVKLPANATWDALGGMAPADIRSQGLWPKGFLPLPHPNHPEGGMLFPQFHIDDVKRQTDRDLTRFDLDFDLPDHLLPEFPPPIFLTTRPDLGDVSQGELVTTQSKLRSRASASARERANGSHAATSASGTSTRLSGCGLPL